MWPLIIQHYVTKQFKKEQMETVGKETAEELRDRSMALYTEAATYALERGVIIGGMTAPGDLDYIDVDNDEDRNFFRIEFY